jgi:hypothetical protein
MDFLSDIGRMNKRQLLLQGLNLGGCLGPIDQCKELTAFLWNA